MGETMTNEEKILARLDELTEELRETKRAIRPYVELKNDFEPYLKDIFHETVMFLQETSNGFEPQALSRLLKEFINNIGNLADALHTLGAVMEFKRDAATLAKPAFDEAIERLEALKSKGVFSAFEQVLDITERMGSRLQTVDLTRAQPVRGVFGMMAALKRPEVQEGLGVLVELATVMAVLKKPRVDDTK